MSSHLIMFSLNAFSAALHNWHILWINKMRNDKNTADLRSGLNIYDSHPLTFLVAPFIHSFIYL